MDRRFPTIRRLTVRFGLALLMGAAPYVLNDYIAVEMTRRPYLIAAAAVERRHDRYPIPPRHIELSRVRGEARLVQNPGW